MKTNRIITAYSLIMMLFLLGPLLAFLPISFSSASFLSYPLPGYSLQWYEKVLQPTPWMFALRNSLIVGSLSTALATVLGTAAAFGLTRKNFRGSSLVLALIVSPMIVPVIVTAVGTYFMFAKFGLVATFSGLVIAHTVLGVPFVVITVSSTLQTFDNRLLQAACGLGASPIHAFFTIVLPIIANGVIAGAIFAFVTSFDDVVVAIFIGGPQQKTLPRQMFEGIKDNIDPSILAMSAILLLVTILLMVFLSLLRRR